MLSKVDNEKVRSWNWVKLIGTSSLEENDVMFPILDDVARTSTF